MNGISETQMAYLAGLIDGEGSIECQKQHPKRGKNPRFVLRVAFVFATPEPLRTVCEWLGVPMKVFPPSDEKRSPRYRAAIPKSIAVELLKECLPYLILKREQAEIILAIESIRAANSPNRRHFGSAKLSVFPAHSIIEMEKLHQELRGMKSNKRRMAARVARVI